LDKTKDPESSFSIAAVEREVGVSKDVLRVWERRYGFPTPHRDARGERAYPSDQVRRLALIKRLMDRGHRPGRLLQASAEELQGLAAAGEGAATEVESESQELAGVMRMVREHDARGLGEALQHRLAQDGLQRFVLDTVAPMATQVGVQWAKGDLQIHEEHLFTEVVTRVLRQAISQLPVGRAPVVLLTTLPDEPHGLGLLMVECLLTLHRARCISLGTQMPMMEIVRAAQAHNVDVVALSFSSAFNARLAPQLVRQFRLALAPQIQLWAGGAGASPLAQVDGVHIPDLASIATVLPAAA
jgi:MerR family transcriptional regulator, light-induced transcriptional regulator